MEAVPNELALLLQRIVSTLPPETHVLVLRHLPTPELARLSCVHKSYRVAWQQLRQQHPGRRCAPPTAPEFELVQSRSRLERAGCFGDVAVIQSMVAAGVDEHGVPLLQAVNSDGHRMVDKALIFAAGGGHVQAVKLLLHSRADVHAADDGALEAASMMGHADVVHRGFSSSTAQM